MEWQVKSSKAPKLKAYIMQLHWEEKGGLRTETENLKIYLQNQNQSHEKKKWSLLRRLKATVKLNFIGSGVCK